MFFVSTLENATMNRLRVFCILVFTLGVSAPLVFAASQQPAQKGWTLSQIVKRAMEEAPQLGIAQGEVQAAEGQAHQAGRWDNPEVSGSGGVVQESVVSGYGVEVGIKQSIPLFGQKSRAAEVERKNVLLAEKNQELTRVNVRHAVIQLAYELAAAEIHVKHGIHRKESIALIGQYLKTRPFASPQQAVEKDLIQNRIREIEEKFMAATTQRIKVWQELNTYLKLGEEISPVISWIEEPSLPNEEELRAATQNKNPELLKQNISVDQAEAELSLANSRKYPNLSIGGSYGFQRTDLSTREYKGLLEFSLPLWDSGWGAQSAARAKRAMEEGRLELVKRKANAEFEGAWATLLASKRKIDLYPVKLISALEGQMNKASANWKKGLVPATAFLELEDQVHEQADHVYEAQVTYVTALSEILLLSGKEFPDSPLGEAR